MFRFFYCATILSTLPEAPKCAVCSSLSDKLKELNDGKNIPLYQKAGAGAPRNSFAYLSAALRPGGQLTAEVSGPNKHLSE